MQGRLSQSPSLTEPEPELKPLNLTEPEPTVVELDTSAVLLVWRRSRNKAVPIKVLNHTSPGGWVGMPAFSYVCSS